MKLETEGCPKIEFRNSNLQELSENDRARYTILPDARKEVLKHLLKLNYEIHEQEVKACLHAKGKTKKKQKANAPGQIKLF